MSDARVTLYTTKFCGFCRSAKRLLSDSDIPFEEIDLTFDRRALAELKARTGHPTVPQIFLDGELIGGFQELRADVQKRGAEHYRPG